MDRVNGIGRVAGGLAIFVSAVMMKGFGETLGISAILGELSFIYDFAVWTCIAIGLVGTTIGMIDLLLGSANISLSNPYYLPVIGRKGRAKKAKINYIDNNKLMDAIEKTVLSPIREVWGLTQNKDSIYHQEYVSTYEGLTPYLEEIVSALNECLEGINKADRSGDTEEEKRLTALVESQLTGSLGAAVDHVVSQMQSIREKETQYKEDVKAAEITLSKENPVYSSQDSPFDTLDVMMAPEREKEELFRRYDKRPKKKKGREKNG
mgnify:CR=1 FL=1|jgi:hypothetical protein